MTNQFSNGYALLVGVGQSAYPAWSLPTTVKDMQALHAALVDPNLCAYPDDEQHLRLLQDAGATKQAIRAGLAWLQAQAKADPQATVVVYYSGHGWVDPAGRYYLIPHDIKPFNIAASALPAADFNAALRQVPAQRLLVFMDCCHAAGMATAKDAPPTLDLPEGYAQAALPKALVEDLKQGAGRAVFTSSRGEQRSWVRPDGTLSLYTYHLIEALQGAGNQPGDTVVNVSNVMNHLGQAVPRSAQAIGREQTPFFDLAAEDFPIAVLRGGKGLPAGGWEVAQQEAAATIQQVTHITQASGEHSVAIGGSVTGSQILPGDHGTVQQGKFNINVGEAQGMVIGDHAQVTQTFGGRAQDPAGATPEQIRALFAPILQQVQARPDDQNVDKEVIVQHVTNIREETVKGEQANPNKVNCWIRFLLEMAPDIGDVVIKTLANPIAGIAEVVRKVAARSGRPA